MVASDSELKTGAVRGARRFYAKALSQAEQIALEEALHVDGIDEEIALLRLRLQRAVLEHPEDVELMFRGAALLSRLVMTKFNLSKADAVDLAETIQRAVLSLNEMDPEAEDAGAV